MIPFIYPLTGIFRENNEYHENPDAKLVWCHVHYHTNLFGWFPSSGIGIFAILICESNFYRSYYFGPVIIWQNLKLKILHKTLDVISH